MKRDLIERITGSATTDAICAILNAVYQAERPPFAVEASRRRIPVEALAAALSGMLAERLSAPPGRQTCPGSAQATWRVFEFMF